MSEVKSAYYKKLHRLHPKNNPKNTQNDYIKLVNAYKKLLAGESYLNCYKIVNFYESNVICRCGAEYEIGFSFVGKVECDFCSCFIIVEEPCHMLPAK